MNRIKQLFERKPRHVLNIYFTAGFPALEDTRELIRALAGSGADMIEIGIPFSDPIADGEVIQASNQRALQNGMSLSLLFEQLEGVRQEVQLPLMLMGYLNPVYQYGMERFCQDCARVGIDGLILPDLPLYEYETQYRELFQQHGLSNVFLVTPQTSEARIRQIDELTDGFIYLVSSSSTTGKTEEVTEEQEAYFRRVAAMNLKNPRLIGFGIRDAESFRHACSYANGAIIGSAFIKSLEGEGKLEERITGFLGRIIG